jgi:serine/threonine-protein kinase
VSGEPQSASGAGSAADPPWPELPERSRFLPGQLVGRDRYRIVSLLGKGGTGEVYRADDLVLGQRVALKFLPETRERDEVWLTRFRHEVRMARVISHPHVCRVHDVGEHEGTVFLSMECVEGEDLQRLLSRVGRLSEAKALELARELCSALAALHDQGLLHRDLKPANVMVDDRGLAKIMDFGLAGWIGTIRDPGSGTVPYLAPEQLAKAELTAATDVYALGLVIYELFTGERAFEDESRSKLAAPASVVEDLDPQIERLILHCLEADPDKRPASAREVAAALPPGEPAIDRDPFPPPALLLLPGDEEGLRPRVARLCLAALVLGAVLIAYLGDATHITRFLDLLAEKARDTISALGYPDLPRSRLYGFAYDPGRLGALTWQELSSEHRHELARGPLSPVSFWYRKSPDKLEPLRTGSAFRSYEDPPATAPGTVGVHLDPQGRLRRFDAVYGEEDGSVREPDWKPLKAAAAFSVAGLEEATPARAPGPFADRRTSWTGAYDGLPGYPMRIEAASYRGLPVWVRVIGPGPRRARPAPGARGLLGSLLRWNPRDVMGLWVVLLLAGAAVVAHRNLRSKRADRKAAFRLAVCLVGARLMVWALGTEHSAGRAELSGFWAHLAWALFCGGLVWTVYVALEPLLRRHWPQQVASWVRLMHGRYRDPRVGRDLLLGALCGVAALAWAQALLLAHAGPERSLIGPEKLGSVVWQVQRSAATQQLEALRGLPHAAAVALHADVEAVLIAFSGVSSAFLLWVVLRRARVAAALWLAVGTVLLNPATGHPVLDLLASGGACALWLALLRWAGLLPVVVATCTAAMLVAVPLTLDVSAWYGGGSAIVLAAVLTLGVHGFLAASSARRLAASL